MKEESFRQVYRFGRFELQPEERRLLDSGVPIDVHSRALDVLAALVARPDQLVTKSDLLSVAWPNLVVEENNLAVQVSALRRILGADAIATVAGRGYRFGWPVDRITLGNKGPLLQRHNLPRRVTSFVGRAHELDEAKAMLRRTRMLTVTGPGGVGKTRFALRLAEDVLATYPDGAWLVELAALADGALVRAAVAHALGMTDRPDALASHVQALRLVLLLDNCEHVLAPAAQLADELLAAGQGIAILATSREPLRVDGEHCLSLPPLALPGNDADTAQIERSESVALFVDRARAQRPAFALANGDAAAAAALCRDLDGMPLALELAAARVSHLSLNEIHTRLADRFGLLTHGVRTALPRQQTLRATIDWSHDLLDERERALLRRLSVFVGSFGLDAAERVASDRGAQLSEVLFRLVACSLVLAERNGDRTRYRLLETTRVYATERLAEAGETSAMRQRHLAYFREAMRAVPEEWLAVSDAEWQGKYGTDLDNARAAFDWAFGDGDDARAGIALVPALVLLTGVAGREENLRVSRLAASRIDAATPLIDQAHVWLHLGAATRAADVHEGIAALDRAIGLFRTVDAPFGLGMALDLRCTRMMHLGRQEDARRDLEESGVHIERSGSAKAQALHLDVRAYFRADIGDFEGARRDLEQALATFVRLGSERRMHSARFALAEVDWRRGDLDAALAGFRGVIELMRSSSLPPIHTLGRSVQCLIGVLVYRNDLDDALALAKQERRLLATSEETLGALDHLALRLAILGELADAARLAGFMDAMYLGWRLNRDRHDKTTRERVQELIQSGLTRADLDRALREGAALTTAEAIGIALG